VAENYIRYPDLSSIVDLDPEAGYVINDIVKKAPLDAPVRVVAQNLN